MDDIFQRIIYAYKKDFKNIGFIPAPRIKKDFNLGRFFHNENGFIFIGSPKSEYTPIYAVYVFPEKRNGSVDKVVELLQMLPNKKYRVRCCIGVNFWKRVGLKIVGETTKNTRNRTITILEGELNLP